MKIDTHQHFWSFDLGHYDWPTPDLPAIYRDFTPTDLRPLLDATGIDATIAVQAAESEAETEYLLSLADQHDWILGVVGWTDLAAADAPEKIARMASHPKLLGLRPMIQTLPDDDWMLRDALRPAIAAMVDENLTFDALVLPRHLPHLAAFLSRYPELNTVIDHCAKPEIRNGLIDKWASDMAGLSAHSHLWCKLSGLVTEAGEDWTADDLQPYLNHVKSAFGPDRLLFGSDWPVLNLASDYAAWVKLVQAFLAPLTDAQRSAIMGGNALRAYPRLAA